MNNDDSTIHHSDVTHRAKNNTVLSSNATVIDGILIIPKGTTSIDKGEYMSRRDFTKIRFPESVTCIEYGAFEDCTALEEVVFPKGLKEIEMYAFRGCTGLKEIVIPESVTNIDEYAFKDCSELERLVVLGDKTILESDDWERDCDGWACVFKGCDKLKEVHMSAAAWELNWNEELARVIFIKPFGGLSGLEVLSLKIEKQVERFLSEQKIPDSDTGTDHLAIARANIFSEDDIENMGSSYYLSISLKNSRLKRKVAGFEVHVALLQGGLEVYDYGHVYQGEERCVDFAITDAGSYRIKDSFVLKKNQTTTRKFTIAYRPWEKDSKNHEYQDPFLLAICCFKVRAIFKDNDENEEFSVWSPFYVSEIGTGITYRLIPDFQYDYACRRVLWGYFESTARYFMKTGIPTGSYIKPLQYVDEADQTELSKIALSDPNIIVRKAAIRRLEDQELLARIAWQFNWEIVENITAIERLEELLEEMTKNDTCPDVVSAAKERIQKLKEEHYKYFDTI
jgi:hypothetical protein